MRYHEFKVKPVEENRKLERWRFQCLYCGEVSFSEGKECSIIFASHEGCPFVESTDGEIVAILDLAAMGLKLRKDMELVNRLARPENGCEVKL